MHHLFLTMVSSRDIVSAFFVSKIFICFAVKLSQTKNIFPPPLEFHSLLKSGNWYPSILNWWCWNLESSFVSSMHISSIFAFLKSLFMIFYRKDFKLRQAIKGLFWYTFLRLIRISRSDSNFRSFVWCEWFSQKWL